MDKILVSCARCKKCALVKSEEAVRGVTSTRSILQCSCSECGHQWKTELQREMPGDAVIPQIPLWLQTRCRGNVLWALNAEHLDDLEKFVEAKVRSMKPRSPYFLPWRLPRWMISRKNRDTVSRGIRRLRAKLPNS